MPQLEIWSRQHSHGEINSFLTNEDLELEWKLTCHGFVQHGFKPTTSKLLEHLLFSASLSINLWADMWESKAGYIKLRRILATIVFTGRAVYDLVP